jgi:hypothetical protein
MSEYALSTLARDDAAEKRSTALPTSLLISSIGP